MGGVQWWMLKKRIHTSWLVAIFCAAIAIGIFVTPYCGSFFAGIPWVLVAIGLATFCLWRGRLYAVPLLLFAGVLLGLWRGGIVMMELSPYAKLVGNMVVLEGRVDEDPERSEKHGTTLRVAVQKVDSHDLGGLAWVSASKGREIKRGDIVTIKGKLAAGFGSFSASMYRAEVVGTKRAPDVALDVRDWFSAQVNRVIPQPEAALGLGFLTGQKQALAPELEEAMKVAGLTHIVVASGYNVTILVRLARRIFARVSKYLAALSSFTLIGGFIAVTGVSPSMARAGLVAGLCLGAWYYGRKFHPLVLLPFVAAITLLVNPTYGWGDLGWQLSFAAFAGVMILAPLMQVYFFGNKKPGMLRQIAGETVAAQVATLPILVGAFGQFSNVALLANILIVPLVPLAMLLVFLTGFMAVIMTPIAYAIGHITTFLLGYMVAVAHFFALLPWAVTEVALPWYGVLASYGVITGICFYFWWATRYDLRSANIVE